MTTQTLKDASCRIIGYTETRSDGVQIGKNAKYHIVGYYDPKADMTKDSHYHIIGRGNLLSSLITRG